MSASAIRFIELAGVAIIALCVLSALCALIPDGGDFE